MDHLLLRQRRVLRRRGLENFLHRREPAPSFLPHRRGKDLLLKPPPSSYALQIQTRQNLKRWIVTISSLIRPTKNILRHATLRGKQRREEKMGLCYEKHAWVPGAEANVGVWPLLGIFEIHEKEVFGPRKCEFRWRKTETQKERMVWGLDRASQSVYMRLRETDW